MKLRRFRHHRHHGTAATRASRTPGAAPAAAAAPVPQPVQAWATPARKPATVREARQHWVDGDWPTLLSLSATDVWRSDDPQRMALMVATAQLQDGALPQAAAWLRDARSAGAGRQAIAQVLLASVHNTLGRAGALIDDPGRSLAHFAASVAMASPASSSARAIQARAGSQLAQLGLNVPVVPERHGVAEGGPPAPLQALVWPWFTAACGSQPQWSADSGSLALVGALAGNGRLWLASARHGDTAGPTAHEVEPDLAIRLQHPRLVLAEGAGVVAGDDGDGHLAMARLVAAPQGGPALKDLQPMGDALAVRGLAVGPGGPVAILESSQGRSLRALRTATELRWPGWAGALSALTVGPNGTMGLALVGASAGTASVVALHADGPLAGRLAAVWRLPDTGGPTGWQSSAVAEAALLWLRPSADTACTHLAWWQEGRLHGKAWPFAGDPRASCVTGSTAPMVLLRERDSWMLWHAGTAADRARPVAGLNDSLEILGLYGSSRPGRFIVVGLLPAGSRAEAARQVVWAQVDAHELLCAAPAADAH